MKYFTTKIPFLIPSYGVKQKETEKMDRYLQLLERSGVLDCIFDDSIINGRPAYNKYDLLATILYCFAFGKGTLRDIESMCKYDLRVIYLMSNEQPKHSIIGKFINDYILPNQEYIFSRITKEIINECKIEIDDAYLDGSKFEADANKYKFVWKPTTFHNKLSEKIRILLSKYNIDRKVPKNGMISSTLVANKLIELSEVIDKENKEMRKDYSLLLEYLTKSLEYEEKERICGPNRNSYYKTDHDATAMCLKEDYYSGLGGNMHAGYNVQVIVSKGLILTYLITQSRNDVADFIPTLNRYYQFYKCYPKRLAADSGYGSEENYDYLKANQIENYVKYFSWQGNVSGQNPSQYIINDDDTITCLNKKIGYELILENRHPKKANARFYKIEGCKDCNFKYYCKRYMNNKDEDYKIFEVNVKLQHYINESEKNLLSPKGIEMRVNRRSQVEGSFGVIKQDFGYERFRRTTIKKVSLEFMLVSLGYNIRKLFKYFDGNAKFNYWRAPNDLQSKAFKKPSAKRLSNKALKKKEMSVNERSKTYKYK